MSHTPGPWVVLDGDEGIGIMDATGDPIVYSKEGICRMADARVIAAAPDLLEFVRQQYESFNCICHFRNSGYTDIPCTKCDAEKLIQKAEGK